MVVSSIKPIKKSIGAYENYIFGKAHNNKKERNLVIFGVGNCKDLAPEDMVKALKYERESFLSSKRKHDAYTLVIAFSDELINDTLREGFYLISNSQNDKELDNEERYYGTPW